MAELNNVLKEMAGEIPGFIATAVVGMDGLGIAEYAADPAFDIEAANAQYTLLVKLVQKSLDQLGDELEDNLTTTDRAYLIAHFLGDGSYYQGIAVDKETGSLGNVRLMVRQYADALWNAIPKRSGRK